MSADPHPASEPVAAVGKALSVLRAFVDGQNEWGVRELSIALGLPSTTVHRLLVRLRREGFLAYDGAEQKYKLGFEFSRMAAAVAHRDGFRQAALPVMRELTMQAGESVWLALYDKEQQRISYIAESESPHASRYLAPLGRTKGLYDSACGLAILSRLPGFEGVAAAGQAAPTAQQLEMARFAHHAGYAVLRASEVGAGMMVSAAVLNRDGQPMGSLGIIVPIHRYGAGQDQYLGSLVRAAADRVSARLGAKLLGGASAGTWHDAIGLIGELLRRQAPSLTITTALGGGSRNLESIGRGEAAYGLTTAASLYDARTVRSSPAKCARKLRAVMHLSELHLLVIMHRDAQLRSTADLAGLRVSPGEHGYSGRRVLQDILRVAETPGTARRSAAGAELYMGHPEGKRQFETGALDVLVWLSGIASPLVQSLEASGLARLHTLEDATLDRLLEINPGYRRGLLPQAAFPAWLSRDMPTLMVPTMLVCHADRSDEEVYLLAKGLYEGRETLGHMSPAYRRIDIDFAIKDLTAPIHPGADLFFREIGGHPTFRLA